jgi:hypothetical protein
LLHLRAHIASKASHGRDELLRKAAEIEKDCEVPEAEEGFDERPRRPAGDKSPPNGKSTDDREPIELGSLWGRDD